MDEGQGCAGRGRTRPRPAAARCTRPGSRRHRRAARRRRPLHAHRGRSAVTSGSAPRQGQLWLVAARPGVPVSSRARVSSRDGGQDGRRADGLGDVVDVGQEDQHRGQDEREGEGDSDLGHEGLDLGGAPRRPEDHQRVDEGRDEDAERDLVEPVLEERAQDPRGELAAGELQDHDGDREHQAGERDHRGDDRRQQRPAPFGPAREEEGQPQRGVERVVERGDPEREQARGEREQQRYRPEAVTQCSQRPLHERGSRDGNCAEVGDRDSTLNEPSGSGTTPVNVRGREEKLRRGRRPLSHDRGDGA